MKLKRTKLLVEPPASATSDIAFILIVFFLVCASVEPDKGRAQTLPSSEPEPQGLRQTLSRASLLIMFTNDIFSEPLKKEIYKIKDPYDIIHSIILVRADYEILFF